MKTWIARGWRAHGARMPRPPAALAPSVALGIALSVAPAFAPGHAAQAADAAARAAHADGKTYRCDLHRSANVCREVRVVADHERRVRMLAEGCASMGGRFVAGASCPQARRVARCMDVVPDPNDLDRLGHTYDAHYYVDAGGSDTQDVWTARSVRRVCDNLMGDFAPE